MLCVFVGVFANECDSDDPLNQTIAENEDWLVTFKRDMGIGG